MSVLYWEKITTHITPMKYHVKLITFIEYFETTFLKSCYVYIYFQIKNIFSSF